MKNKLTKAINEMYFRNYTKLDFDKKSFPITNNINEIYFDILDVMDEVSDEFIKMIEDLVNNDHPEAVFRSEVANRVIKERNACEKKFALYFKPSKVTQEVSNILKGLSDESYYVGGMVRDLCRGKEAKDVDYCTDTDMNVLVDVFSHRGFKCDEVGLQFLVLVVSKENEDGEIESFEVANFRSDRDNSGGEKGTMQEDAKRRDFSVNAGYVRIFDGKLFDPNETFVDDMNTNTLRFVGKAKDRLEEDSARCFRFYRFLGRGFVADKKSLKAVREMFDECTRKTASERIRMEIEKIVGV